MNYCEFHLGDYAKAAGHLSLIEHGVYFGLLRKYYSGEKPLPVDVGDVQRLVGARTEEEKDATLIVLREFFVLSEDGHHQARCDEEIARFRDKQEKARRSANARWSAGKSKSMGSALDGDQQSEANADERTNAMRPHNDGKALQSPDASNHCSVPKGTGVDGPEPNKTAHATAEPTSERQFAEHYVALAALEPETAQERSRESSSALWRGGKSLLWLDAGLPSAKGGELLGKLRSEYGDMVLTNALAAMCRERPLGPVAWLKRACQLRAGEVSNTNKQSRLEAANDAVGEAWLAGEVSNVINHQTALEAANDAVGAAFLAGAHT